MLLLDNKNFVYNGDNNDMPIKILNFNITIDGCYDISTMGLLVV